ncbi:MAG: hypothetical protein AAF220_12840, partial [Pseudomonadota bacterium]
MSRYWKLFRAALSWKITLVVFAAFLGAEVIALYRAMVGFERDQIAVVQTKVEAVLANTSALA